MTSDKSPRVQSLGLWAVLVLSVFAWAPVAYPGYWQTTVGFAPVYNALRAAPIADVASPPDLWRGSGAAAFLLARPLLALGVSPVVAVRAVFGLLLVMGGLGIYVWLRPRCGDRGAGAAGLAYALLPPVLTTVYVRGDLADATVLGILPLVLAGLTHYRFSRNPAAIGLSVIGLLWIWRSQAGLAVFASVMLVLYALWIGRDQLAALAMAVASAAGMLSLAPLWGLRAAVPVNFFDHFLTAGNLTWAVAPGRERIVLGPLPLAAGLVVLWLLWTRRGREADATASPRLLPDQERLIGGGLLIWGALSLLGLGFSAPLWRLSGADRLLTYPWQTQLVVMPFAAMAVGALPLLAPALARRGPWVGLLGATLLAGLPHLSPAFTDYAPPEQPLAVLGSGGQVVLLEADLESRATPDGGVAELSLAWQPLTEQDVDYNLFFQALRWSGEDRYEVVAQLDQQPLPQRPATLWQPGEILTGTYSLTLPLDPKAQPLRYYVGLYDWRDGDRLSVTTAVAIGGSDNKVILYDE